MALFLSVFVIPASAYASTDFSVISPSKISSLFKDDHKKRKTSITIKKSLCGTGGGMIRIEVTTTIGMMMKIGIMKMDTQVLRIYGKNITVSKQTYP